MRCRPLQTSAQTGPLRGTAFKPRPQRCRSENWGKKDSRGGSLCSDLSEGLQPSSHLSFPSCGGEAACSQAWWEMGRKTCPVRLSSHMNLFDICGNMAGPLFFHREAPPSLSSFKGKPPLEDLLSAFSAAYFSVWIPSSEAIRRPDFIGPWKDFGFYLSMVRRLWILSR